MVILQKLSLFKSFFFVEFWVVVNQIKQKLFIALRYTNFTNLAGQTGVQDLIKDCIEQVNRSLAADTALAGSQIHRFLLLHKELDADDGELTRTRKVRRRIIADRYGSLIEALYGETDHIEVESQVTFEDGRVGKMQADLAIRSAATIAPGSSQRAA